MLGWKLALELEAVNRKLFLPPSMSSLAVLHPWKTAASPALLLLFRADCTQILGIFFLFLTPGASRFLGAVLTVTPVGRVCVYMAILIFPCVHHTQVGILRAMTCLLLTHPPSCLPPPSKIIYRIELAFKDLVLSDSQGHL